MSKELDVYNKVSGYESPVKIFLGELHEKVEGRLLKAIQDVGISVDKQELLKALKNDRDQYAKGYQDGVRDSKENSEWLPYPEFEPEYGNYLITIRHKETGELLIDIDYYASFGWDDYYDSKVFDVIAWRGFPKPYEGTRK